jgi:nucleoside-diphosphate-sugar epimerase
MKTTLGISGCAGYIGSYAIGYFLNQGYKVRGLDNLFKGHADALFAYISNPNFEFIKGDVTNYNDCEKLINGCDYILHGASLVGMPICKQWPHLAKLVNVGGTENMIRARNKINENIKFFGCFTGSQYGIIEGICTEDSPQNTDTVYGLTKKEAEEIVIREKNTIGYRFATCFGISNSMRVNLLVNDFVNQAVNNKCIPIFEPDARRTFIHISDFVKSIEFAFLNMDRMKYKIYNAGDDALNWTKRELGEYISKKTGCITFYGNFGKDDDKRDYSCSYKRLNNEGFKCQTSMEDGIDALIKGAKLISMRNPYS